jgi:hypothetical protein
MPIPIWNSDQVVTYSRYLQFLFILVPPPTGEEGSDVLIDAKCAPRTVKADPYFLSELLGSLHGYSESFIFCLCYLQDCHDLLHSGYEGDHFSMNAALAGCWLFCLSWPLVLQVLLPLRHTSFLE